MAEAFAADFSDPLGFLQSLDGLLDATNGKSDYVRNLIQRGTWIGF